MLAIDVHDELTINVFLNIELESGDADKLRDKGGETLCAVKPDLVFHGLRIDDF